MEVLLFAAVLLLSLFLIPLGLPGTWIMIGAAIGYDALMAGDPVGWFTIGATMVLAAIAEVFEFTFASRGVGRDHRWHRGRDRRRAGADHRLGDRCVRRIVRGRVGGRVLPARRD